MKNLKINWEVPYEEGDDLSESFGTAAEEMQKFVELCQDDARENPEDRASTTVVKALENGTLTGSVALVLVTIALKDFN